MKNKLFCFLLFCLFLFPLSVFAKNMDVVIVTGASQGLGRAICVALSRVYGERLEKTFTFFLLARNWDGLRETAAEMTKDRHNIRGDIIILITLGGQEGNPDSFLFRH